MPARKSICQSSARKRGAQGSDLGDIPYLWPVPEPIFQVPIRSAMEQPDHRHPGHPGRGEAERESSRNAVGAELCVRCERQGRTGPSSPSVAASWALGRAAPGEAETVRGAPPASSPSWTTRPGAASTTAAPRRCGRGWTPPSPTPPPTRRADSAQRELRNSRSGCQSAALEGGSFRHGMCVVNLRFAKMPNSDPWAQTARTSTRTVCTCTQELRTACCFFIVSLLQSLLSHAAQAPLMSRS